jgi:hypothetical protein
MIWKIGFIGFLKADKDFPNFQAYHCIINQLALCSKLKDYELEKVIDDVVKIVNLFG